MEWDYDRKKEKEAEFLVEIENQLRLAGIPEGQIKSTAKEFFEKSVSITPPEKKAMVIEMITMHPSGRGGGRSTKAGNIRLNIGSLFNAVAGGVFTVISAAQAPWAIPFAGILLWNSMWQSVKVDLSENDAVTLWAMWQVKDTNKLVSEEDIKSAVDRHAAKYQRSTLSEADIKFAIKNLSAIGCIKRPRDDPNKWWLCEWIAPAYR
jgi:hypothetical protein